MCLTTVTLIRVRFVSARNELLDYCYYSSVLQFLYELRNLERFFSH